MMSKTRHIPINAKVGFQAIFFTSQPCSTDCRSLVSDQEDHEDSRLKLQEKLRKLHCLHRLRSHSKDSCSQNDRKDIIKIRYN